MHSNADYKQTSAPNYIHSMPVNTPRHNYIGNYRANKMIQRKNSLYQHEKNLTS
jgi:hypothetical protein